MIAERIVTEPTVRKIYFAVCASCQNEGPKMEDEHLANIAVILDGWDARHAIIGDAIITLYTCPTCMGGKQ